MRLLIAFQAGLVDGVQHGSAQQSNAMQALHQQQADQLAAAAHLIMVHRDDILVSRAANGNKGDAAFCSMGISGSRSSVRARITPSILRLTNRRCIGLVSCSPTIVISTS